MRKLPEAFIEEAKKQTNTPIDLIAFEVTPSFTSYCRTGTTGQVVTIDPITSGAIIDWETDVGLDINTDIQNCVANLASGTAWIMGCDEGLNSGANRLVTGYTDGQITYSGQMPYSFIFDGDNPDRVRLSKYLFLAVANAPVGFFVPDSTETDSCSITYVPFPMSIEPIGSNISFEIMDMTVAVSNINKVVGNAIQTANGLRGNRLYHMKVFNDLLSDKSYCIKEVMYIDSITISPTEVSFKLESKFNIIDVEIPLRMYYRDFCGFTYKSPECGYGFDYYIGAGVNASGQYPLASEDNCDHTLRGPNGCLAHDNTCRFGGFMVIPPT